MRSLALLYISLALLQAEDWTRFRGPNGSGVSNDTGFPTELGKTKNLVWRTPVRPGKSSPILTPTRVIITAFEQDKLYTQSFDRNAGKLLWERSLDRKRSEVVNQLNHAAAVTPVTDGENVYVFFKDFGLICYDASGKTRWTVPLGPFSNVMGVGASPILVGDLVIVTIDQMDNSFIAAFDKGNGEMRWKAAREETDAWGTSAVYTPAAGGSLQILTAARGQVGLHDSADGKRTLTHVGIPPAMVGSPVMAGDTLFLFGYGFDAPSKFADRLKALDKNGDGQLSPDEYGTEAFLYGIGKYIGNRDGIITREKWDLKQRELLGLNGLVALRLEPREGVLKIRELWRYTKSFTNVIPTLLVYDGVVYTIKNGGILTTLDRETGEPIKVARVEGAPGGYSASPVAAEGKVYLASEEGNVSVLKAGGDWRVLSAAELGEACYATPALSAGSVFVRTSEALYRFASKP